MHFIKDFLVEGYGTCTFRNGKIVNTVKCNVLFPPLPAIVICLVLVLVTALKEPKCDDVYRDATSKNPSVTLYTGKRYDKRKTTSQTNHIIAFIYTAGWDHGLVVALKNI